MITITVEERKLIEEIIAQNKVCYVGMIGVDNYPYVLPMNFGFDEDIIYLHSAQTGKHITSLENNNNVCITFCTESSIIYQDIDVACSYRAKASSVICKGKVLFEENFDEKVKALNMIMKQYSDRTFSYSDPAINNVKVWRVVIEEMTSKMFGMPNPNSRSYKDRDTF